MILHIDVEWVLRSYWFILPIGKTTKEAFAELIKKHASMEEVKNRFAIHVLENMPYEANFIRQHGDWVSIQY